MRQSCDVAGHLSARPRVDELLRVQPECAHCAGVLLGRQATTVEFGLPFHERHALADDSAREDHRRHLVEHSL